MREKRREEKVVATSGQWCKMGCARCVEMRGLWPCERELRDEEGLRKLRESEKLLKS